MLFCVPDSNPFRVSLILRIRSVGSNPRLIDCRRIIDINSLILQHQVKLHIIHEPLIRVHVFPVQLSQREGSGFVLEYYPLLMSCCLRAGSYRCIHDIDCISSFNLYIASRCISLIKVICITSINAAGNLRGICSIPGIESGNSRFNSIICRALSR